ncbi:magnesium-protoporphyrin IX monomethyl ester (oxidative) cyclase [Leptolyngbya sp. FACHB-261]|uniref:magnesium-protoporphyrin IX monomethyl ester (oxidative) cyclase n=1 Tax=Leptolyngbya sp. FACHB-261 TaxID=2692806 RepID=UPI001685B79C|nr:magnesium-protoporphyrin IX monomethyl ester (oxidative) cyclase [Leptolyngbya sp. FACHB-261]MBD2104527.1 magnesium-protoporphyrin IX monomethyl ester (oxidative) cyclase [Leptolyngbya sp. FACHB-261]
MVDSLHKADSLQEQRPGVKVPSKDTILTPRFYTTNFEEMAELDISSREADFQALLDEFRTDYNRHHFVRGDAFNQSLDHLDPEARRLFVEFLERSCTAEFSGFLLYKELSRKLKDSSPVLAECFNLMSRDEARHAGFLNKAMSDFNLALDLSFLTKSKSYTYFAPKFIFYATYLSEKIGYWRYIKIYRHLEAHPENRIYPIFQFFENWCQDESRHGDFFALLMKSQPQFLNDWKAKLWCRFFLLSVFATMYMNDVALRPEFYQLLGMNPRDYDLDVIEKTNRDAAKVFPVVLDTANPEFTARLDNCVDKARRLSAIGKSNAPALIQSLQKVPPILGIGWQLIRLYFMKPVPAAAPGTVR